MKEGDGRIFRSIGIKVIIDADIFIEFIDTFIFEVDIMIREVIIIIIDRFVSIREGFNDRIKIGDKFGDKVGYRSVRKVVDI